MLRIIRNIAFPVALTLILAATSFVHAGGKKEPVTLQFRSLQISEGSPKIEWRANSLLVKKFFQEHDYIKMKMLSNLSLPGEMNVAGADMTMSMVGDAAPDVFDVRMDEFAKSIEQGFLMPLDDYVANWPEAKERLKGPLREMCSGIGPDGKKHIYALPFSVSTRCLLYNRKRFREVGLIDANGNTVGPRDWDEMWEFGKKLYDADIDPETKLPKRWAIRMPLEGWFFNELPASAGGSWAKKRPDGTWETLIDGEACVRSLDMLKKFCWEPWTDKKGRRIKGVMEMSTMTAQQTGGQSRSTLKIEGRDLLESGVEGMQMHSIYAAFNERVYKDPLKFGIVQFPKYPGPEGRYASKLSGELMAIRSTIKDKRVADAAWEYISYMCGEQGEREKTKIFVDNGVARYVNPALLKKYGFPQYVVDQVPRDWALAYEQIFVSAYAANDPPGLPAILQELSAPCKQLVRDENQDSKKALAAVQRVVSRSYLYTPTEKEMNHNRKIAVVVVGLMLAAMVFGGMAMLKAQIRGNLADEREKAYVRKVPTSKQLLGWSLMAPAILSVLLWQYVPVGWGSVMAFLNVHVLGGSEWVGLDNFIRVAMRPLFWLAWKNTIIYVGLSLAMGFVAPIALALLLSEIPKGKTLFRTLYYLPALTTGVVTMLLWMRFYDPTEFGLINRILLSFNDFLLVHVNNLLSLLHIPWQIPLLVKQQWLQDPKLAMAATILPSIWAGMGPGCIIYLAALKAVPDEQYDAADLDGAGIFQKAWHVTLPTIFPLVLINFLGAFIGAFHSAGNILVMTGGGPNHATHVMALEIFFNGYVLANYGQTTAIAWILASLLVGFAVLQMRIFARMKFSTAEQKE